MLHLSVADGVHRIEDAYTNWYVVEDDGALLVVDTAHPRSWGSLQELLQRLKRDQGEIHAVVLTHAHFDHVGFAERARTELGVSVFAHEREVPVTRHPLRYDHERSRLPYMLRHPGFDRAFAAMAAMGACGRRVWSTCGRTRTARCSTCPGGRMWSSPPGTPTGTAPCTSPSAAC